MNESIIPAEQHYTACASLAAVGVHIRSAPPVRSNPRESTHWAEDGQAFADRQAL
jgi:hypothetical protein